MSLLIHIWAAGDTWVCNQRCGYWWPGANAPGRQYPQCWHNHYCVTQDSYKNITYIGNNRRNLNCILKKKDPFLVCVCSVFHAANHITNTYNRAITSTKLVSWRCHLSHAEVSGSGNGEVNISIPGTWWVHLCSQWFEKHLLEWKHSNHDDAITWKCFPRYWPFVRGIHRWLVVPLTKARCMVLWCFVWYMPELMVEQTVELLVIWDAILIIWCPCNLLENFL